MRASTRIGIVVRQSLKQGIHLCRSWKINEKLTRIIRGRSIELILQEEGLVTIVFDDYSTMRLKVAGGPTMNTLTETKIESVAESGAELTLVGEDSGTATLRLAQA